MRIFCLLSILCLSPTLFGQNTLKGIVVDQKGESLPFVNILLNDSPKDGLSTDIDGRFEIKDGTDVSSLTLSYVGFEQLRILPPFANPLRIELQATAYNIETIEIIAGENPAHRIIKKAVKNIPLNDHEQLPAYECLTYNKMTMGFEPNSAQLDSAYAQMDTSKTRIKNGYLRTKQAHDNFRDTDIMLVESVSKRKFKYPKDLQEEILHNRVSGFQELPLATLATDAQPFSFYEENLHILNEPYLNPISKGSTKKYFFMIEDTLYQAQDTVFILSFKPKKGKNFTGLKGVLYIHTNQYAIQNVLAEPNDKKLAHFKIEQKYQWIGNQHWFPEQLNFEIAWENMAQSYMSFFGHGKTYIKDINLNPTFEKKTFKNAEQIVFTDEAFSTSDSIWNTHRLEPLTDREINTYRLVDSLGKVHKLEKWTKRLAALGEGRFPLGTVDWLITDAIAFNNYEKVRLGLGLSTNRKLSDKFEVGGYYAYGFGDKAWKYGTNLALFFDKYQFNRIDIWYKKDIAVPAILDFSLSDNFLSARLFSNLIDKSDYKGIIFNNRPFKYLSTRFTFGQEQITPTYDYNYLSKELANSYIFTEAVVGIRFAYNEKFSRFLGYNVFNASSFPVLELNYTKGFDNIWNGQYKYDKWLISLAHNFPTRQLGHTHYRLEAGFINSAVPFSRLFTAPAFGNGGSVQLLANSFRTMGAYEFLSDQFVHFYFRQDFGSLLFKAKKIHPKIAIEHNIAFGSLSDSQLHQDIAIKTLEKGFFEVGLVVNDLIRINYFGVLYYGLGVSAFYRYGPNALPTFKENRSLQLTITTSF